MSFTCPYCGQPHEKGTSVCPATNENISSAYFYVGTTIAEKYEVLDLLGEGGMGAVYLAKHIQVGKKFAIKLLHEQFAHHAEMVERFMREARAAGEVGHENIIEVYDIGRDTTGAVYMVMEILKGSPLEDVVRAGPIEHSVATYIMLQVLSALEAAHAHGIVHRDMKPDNVFLTTIAGNQNFVKVLDFGIAKMKSGEGGHGLTQTGTMMGTPYYMSPEQARGAKDIDHRTDLYACGVMFYQMLSGQLPFEAPNIPALLVKITAEEPVPLEQIAPQVPPEICAAVRSAMAKEPDERFQNAGEFAAAIGPFASQGVALQGLAAAKPAFDTNAPVTAGGSTGTGVGQTTPMGWTATGEEVEKPSRVGLVVGVILVLLLLVGGGGVVAALFATGVLGGKQEPEKSKPIVAVQPTDPGDEEPKSVQFNLLVEPEGATVTLDKEKLEGNPIKREFDRTSESRLLKITLAGHEDHKEWVRLDEDFNKTITLKAIETEPEDGGSKKGGKGKKGKGTKTVTVEKGDSEDAPPPEIKIKKTDGGKGGKGGKGKIDEDNPYK